MRKFCIIGCLALVTSCTEKSQRYARAFEMTSMAQSIGGPAATGRPGDFVLENDKIRAIIHGRRHSRSTLPIINGSLMDLDLQRPQRPFGVGKGRDAFYELGAMVNLQVSGGEAVKAGFCDEVGRSPCPTPPASLSAEEKANFRCARVAVTGTGDNMIGVIGLLNLALERDYPDEVEIITDYDVCPGESLVRLTSTLRFYGEGTTREMPELSDVTGFIDVLLGQTANIDCARDACPPEAPFCDDLLISLTLGTLNTEMKRCRSGDHNLAGVMAGDFIFFSAKAGIFIPGSGFDFDTYIRSVFDIGGDVFSNPLALEYVAAAGDDVSYAYFNQSGKMMIPVFGAAFTASMSNAFACPRSDPDCFMGEELVYRRFVSVGKGDVGSALEPFYKLRGQPTGLLVGHVLEQRTREPRSGSDVYLFKLPKAWASLTDAQLIAKTPEQLRAQHRAETRTLINPVGDIGLVSQFQTDVGVDPIRDGKFGGRVPAGRYVLIAQDRGRPSSGLTPVTVVADATARVTLISGEPATLAYRVTDSSGVPMPAKLTVGHCFAECARDADCAGATPTCDTTTRLCVPQAGYRSADDCRPDQSWDAAANTCRCSKHGALPLEFGGTRFADGAVRTEFTASGSGELRLPPGTYQVIASRGFEYELARTFVTVKPGGVARFDARLERSVDTRGWIAADFHVHGPNSVDSSLSHSRRVVSYAAEGVEFMTATDHDQLTDYGPTIHQLGLRQWLKSQIGFEVSPLDYGHFIGFPLKFDENADLNGGFHWREAFPGGTPDWRNVPPTRVYSMLRELGDVAAPVVLIAHFYDHFNFYGVDPFTLELPDFSINAFFNPVLQPSNFSVKFDALEVLNGKNFDLIRRPTWAEIRDYNRQLAQVLNDTSLSFEEQQRKSAEISTAVQREFLKRTAAEQALAINYTNTDFSCRCTADDECGENSLCDAATGGCVPACTSFAQCDQTLVDASREACLPVDSDPARRRCQRRSKNCAADGDCATPWPGNAMEVCATQGALTGTCQFACTSDTDCSTDPMRSVCDTTDGYCVAPTIVAASDMDPCPPVAGTVDDWFQMLNRGIRRTLLGNSDSHGVYDTEAGIPRSYVRSSTDRPAQVDQAAVADQVHKMGVFSTFGPFIEFTINERGLGETVAGAAGQNVSLKIKVQSALWFDVDRIEIYRNGQMIRAIEGAEDCVPTTGDCIKVPNDTVVNFEQVITDAPDKDAWYVVIAMGLDGKGLAPVYSSVPVARLGIFELIQRLTPLLPPLRSLRIPLSPTIGSPRPYAITNPIFVDVDGDGEIAPVSPPPTWLAFSTALGNPFTFGEKVPQVPQQPRHDHSRGLGRMRRDATNFKAYLDQIESNPNLANQLMRMIRSLGH